MERVRDLIHKLSVQEGAGEAPAALLATVRALAAELEALLPRSGAGAGGRVAVLMPHGVAPATPEPKPAAPAKEPEPVPPVSEPEPEPQPEPIPDPPAAPLQEPIPDPPPAPEVEPVTEPAPAPAPAPELSTPPPAEPYALRPPAFDPLAEVPTLTQQTPPKEVFERHTPGESLNDRLKRSDKELGHKLVETPIKDLRKGIGINDRYLFLSELFRGDEAMYERSIKTINSFHILPEAEYWINRELKVKLGWDDDTASVQHFYQLVRRRFS